MLFEEIDKELDMREPILALAAEAAPLADKYGSVEPLLSSGVFFKNSSRSVVARILVLRGIDHEIIAVRSEAEVLLALAVDLDGGSRARNTGVRPIAVLHNENALICDLADSGRYFIDKRRILLDIKLSDIVISGLAGYILEDITGYLLEIFDLVASLFIEEIADELEALYALITDNRADCGRNELLEELAAVGAEEGLVEHIEAEERGMIRKASRNVLPHGRKVIYESLAVIFAVIPEIIECALSCLAPEIACRPDKLGLLGLIGIGYRSPIGCSVAVAARGIEILMHIKEHIDPVSGAEVEYAVHIIEVLVVVFAGLGFDHAPRCTEANEIETAGGHIAEQLVVDIEFVLVVLAVFALIYDIDAVEYTLSAVFIDKASFFGNDTLHNALLNSSKFN